MKFNIFFIIEGPAGKIEAPNTTNPIESAGLPSLLTELVDKIPYGDPQGFIKTIGIRIEKVPGK